MPLQALWERETTAIYWKNGEFHPNPVCTETPLGSAPKSALSVILTEEAPSEHSQGEHSGEHPDVREHCRENSGEHCRRFPCQRSRFPLAAQCEIPPHIAQYPFEIVLRRGVSHAFCLVFIGYRASIAEITLLRGGYRTGGGIAANWPC